jgi:cytochrome P450
MGPISFRTAMPGATIDGKAIAPGTNVALAPGIAMLDPTVFTDPDEINLARPASAAYLHFGTGLHACRGQYLATPLLREMFRAIVMLPRLRRAAGDLGKKRQRYPLMVDGLTVRFDPI